MFAGGNDAAATSPEFFNDCHKNLQAFGFATLERRGLEAAAFSSSETATSDRSLAGFGDLGDGSLIDRPRSAFGFAGLFIGANAATASSASIAASAVSQWSRDLPSGEPSSSQI
jgi:hypothetical protein